MLLLVFSSVVCCGVCVICLVNSVGRVVCLGNVWLVVLWVWISFLCLVVDSGLSLLRWCLLFFIRVCRKVLICCVVVFMGKLVLNIL